MFLFYNCFIGFAEMNRTGLGVLWSAYALAKASVRRPQRVIEKKLMPTSKKRAEPLEPKSFHWPAYLPAPPPPPKLGAVQPLNLPPPPRPPGKWN